MTKDEALKLALEALEGVLDNSPKVLEASISGGLYEVVQCRDAITAIKEALAQTQEPYALESLMYSNDRIKVDPVTGNVSIGTPQRTEQEPDDIASILACRDMLDAQPVPPRTEQEPVAHWSDCSVHSEPAYPKGECDCGGFTTPPQRTWVGLTDEEIEQGCKESWVTEQAWQSAVWWAEAKLKEKNT